jgi:hypothetical protein
MGDLPPLGLFCGKSGGPYKGVGTSPWVQVRLARGGAPAGLVPFKCGISLRSAPPCNAPRAARGETHVPDIFARARLQQIERCISRNPLRQIQLLFLAGKPLPC